MKKGKDYKILGSKFLGCNLASYYNWSKSKRAVISFMEKYLTKEDLDEFLKTGKVERLEKAFFVESEVYEVNSLKYLSSFLTAEIDHSNKDFFIFYFNFLNELKKAINNEKTIDNFLFNNSFYVVKFENLINIFLVYFTGQFKNQNIILTKTYSIIKNFYIFKEWDAYMLLFLKESINRNFKNIYNKHDDEKMKQEAFYHIAGFYIFTDNKFNNLDNDQKFELLTITEQKYMQLPISDDNIDILHENILLQIT